MNLSSVMDAVATRLDTIAGLRVYAWPQAAVSPPAALVCYPDRIEYDETYQRGYDMLTLRVVVLAGRVSDRAARDIVAGYAAGSGASSIKAVLESGTYTAFGTIAVQNCEFDSYPQSGQDYLAVIFNVEITGSGT